MIFFEFYEDFDSWCFSCSSRLKKYFAFFSMIYWSIVEIIIHLERYFPGLSIYVKCVETVGNSDDTILDNGDMVHRQWRMPD
jgi:hypothetical protein